MSIPVFSLSDYGSNRPLPTIENKLPSCLAAIVTVTAAYSSDCDSHNNTRMRICNFNAETVGPRLLHEYHHFFPDML